MPSKFDRLRAGEVVEIEPGRKGRLNQENKSFETSDGRTMYVGDDPDFYPPDDRALSFSREKESLNREIKKAPAGEFLHQFGNQGIAGAAKDWYNKITKKGDDYLQSKRVNEQVGSEISERSPWTSGAATAASFIPDIAITKGMGAAGAAPLLAGVHAGPRILEEPEQVAGEALFSSLGGKLIDKGGQFANRIAQRRGQARALPGQQAAVREANAAQTEQFNALKQNVKTINETKLKQYQDDLNVRQNQIIKDQNAYEQAKLQRDTQVLRLKNKADMEKAQRSATAAQADAEYKAAKEAAEQENKRALEKFKLDQAQYQADLKNLPNLQKQAQEEYSQNVLRNAESVSNAFPKESKIFTSQLGVGDFIDESVKKTSLAGSREANQASKILKSIFPEGEILTGKDLAGRYKALEGAIQKSTPEVQRVLNEFKTHMGDRLPTILADNMAYARVVPMLRKQVEKEVMSVLDSMPLAQVGMSSRPFLKSQATNNMNQLFREMTPQDFLRKMQSGEIRQQLINGIIKPSDFSSGGLASLKPGRKAMKITSEELERMGVNVPNPGQAKFDEFTNMLSSKLDKALAKAELKVIATDVDASKKLGAKVRKTYGTAEPVPPPSSPIAPEPLAAPLPPGELPPVAPPQFPPPVAPPQTPALPSKPGMMPEPLPPNFIPTPELPVAQGLAERAGDFLEKPLLQQQGRSPMNNLMKLGGLKYLLGKAALPAEAAYLGMKGLTSPTAAGEAVRMSFKQGGIQAIDAWAQKYPSYQNGILQNPQERRSLTKEVEDDSEIPIEQKAVIQSKINRGKPLQDRL
jgi:hypothetical protein